MAYMSQERKAELSKGIKEVCKRYNIKATIAVRHHSTLVLNIKQGGLDFLGQYNDRAWKEHQENRRLHYRFEPAKYIQLNTYNLSRWTGKEGEFLREVVAEMNKGNHNRSDIMTDYFDVGWYVDVNIGQWDKPYKVVR